MTQGKRLSQLKARAYRELRIYESRCDHVRADAMRKVLEAIIAKQELFRREGTP